MRFDDSLETVLAADMTTPFGAQSAWRQLVDLIGRGRVESDPVTIDRLTAIRATIPPPVRAASARALVGAQPPAALVRLFALDGITIAAPVLRTAKIDAADWIALLPDMSPAARSILRHRRDLPDAVVRSLESFGSVDFVLSSPPGAPTIEPSRIVESDAAARNEHPVSQPAPQTSTFVSVADIALGLPVVAEALRHRTVDNAAPENEPAATGPDTPSGTFQIAELVARIDAYRKRRDEAPTAALPGTGPEVQPELFALDHAPAPSFRFETDAAGIVRWIEGAARAPLIGLSLDLDALPGTSRVDGVAGGAFRRRAAFTDARLVVAGMSDAAGQWRINGIPVFDRASGRFTGYRGTARRPRADEMAEPVRAGHHPSSDALRQLVHELRTPANAIAGFAEMIESQILGAVPEGYRAHATAIREQARDLLGAIDDIDLAARLESDALDLRPDEVPVAPLLERIAEDLVPLARLRGVLLTIDAGTGGIAIAGDARAVERLLGRLLATLLSSGSAGERIGVTAGESDRIVALAFDRPRALGAYAEDRLLTIDAETEAEREGAPLLGTGFALRLARNLAVELGGTLTIGDNALTLRLPAAFLPGVEQASSS